MKHFAKTMAFGMKGEASSNALRFSPQTNSSLNSSSVSCIYPRASAFSNLGSTQTPSLHSPPSRPTPATCLQCTPARHRRQRDAAIRASFAPAGRFLSCRPKKCPITQPNMPATRENGEWMMSRSPRHSTVAERCTRGNGGAARSLHRSSAPHDAHQTSPKHRRRTGIGPWRPV